MKKIPCSTNEVNEHEWSKDYKNVSIIFFSDHWTHTDVSQHHSQSLLSPMEVHPSLLNGRRSSYQCVTQFGRASATPSHNPHHRYWMVRYVGYGRQFGRFASISDVTLHHQQRRHVGIADCVVKDRLAPAVAYVQRHTILLERMHPRLPKLMPKSKCSPSSGSVTGLPEKSHAQAASSAVAIFYIKEEF